MKEIEKKLWRKAFFYVGILQIVPFVKMVSVCNSLAFSAVDEKSDIDLFIVAKNGRLFFVRTMITFILHILAVRRHGNKVSGRFCLSFFIDESAANLHSLALKKDVYLAYWISSMVPLIDRSFSKDFLEKNFWIEDYFESSLRLDTSKVLPLSTFKRFLNGFVAMVFKGKFGDFCESKLMKWQLKRAKGKSINASKDASLVINEHILKFHNIDRRQKYADAWQEKFGDLKLTDERFLALRHFL